MSRLVEFFIDVPICRNCWRNHLKMMAKTVIYLTRPPVKLFIHLNPIIRSNFHRFLKTQFSLFKINANQDADDDLVDQLWGADYGDEEKVGGAADDPNQKAYQEGLLIGKQKNLVKNIHFQSFEQMYFILTQLIFYQTFCQEISASLDQFFPGAGTPSQQNEQPADSQQIRLKKQKVRKALQQVEERIGKIN